MAGAANDDRPPPEPDGAEAFAWGRAWFAPVPGEEGYWVEIAGGSADDWGRIAPVLAPLLAQERDSLALADELTDRYEEIELLYTMAETLGHTIGLEEACRVIVREVGAVVGARRASILVHDPREDVLRPVAGWGVEVGTFEPVPRDDPDSVAARVFRERRVLANDPRVHRGAGRTDRPYRGHAYLSVPILYPQPGEMPRPVGVINLTDRLGTDAFSDGDAKLVSAIANQIAAMIENARLVERDRRRQRMSREMELASDLQMKLLKPPNLPDVDLAARCDPAESVGGDFYHVVRLPGHRLGVMVGDVSSHGFGAALMMATVLSAAGIHAEDAATPDEALRRILESVGDELEEAEMFLTAFYAVVDPAATVLRYANAGHPHAWRMGLDGAATRLDATSPPLGLASPDTIASSDAPWGAPGDLLVLFSDGVVDAENEEGEAFGEARILEAVREAREAPVKRIVDAVFHQLQRYGAGRRDDRTLLVMRA